MTCLDECIYIRQYVCMYVIQICHCCVARTNARNNIHRDDKVKVNTWFKYDLDGESGCTYIHTNIHTYHMQNRGKSGRKEEKPNSI